MRSMSAMRKGGARPRWSDNSFTAVAKAALMPLSSAKPMAGGGGRRRWVA